MRRMSDGDDMLIGSVLYEITGAMDQLAPGSAESTRRALALVPDLEGRKRALDLGCGTGASTLTLADALAEDAEIIAVDVHPPYIQRLRGRAKAAGLDKKIRPRVADMRSLGVKSNTFDLVWAEGSLYTIGFADGCEMCRRLLAPGGTIGATELVWLSDTPSDEARAFWARGYPDMRRREDISAGMASHGYEVHGDFVLPASDWAAYYDSLRRRIATFESRRDDALVRQAIATLEAEMQMYADHGDEYGYVFYVASWPGPSI